MPRFSKSTMIKSMHRHILPDGCKTNSAKGTGILAIDRQPCDVFINHRGIDTKKSFAGLLFQYMSLRHVHCFLDCKNMKPGDKLFDNINRAIHRCKVGVAVLSPRYCESTYCLHELALMMEMKKKVIPVFYDVQPSQLHIENTATYSTWDLDRYRWAHEEARNTVGLTFDSLKQDWSEMLRDASSAVMKNLAEVEEDRPQSIPNPPGWEAQLINQHMSIEFHKSLKNPIKEKYPV